MNKMNKPSLCLAIAHFDDVSRCPHLDDFLSAIPAEKNRKKDTDPDQGGSSGLVGTIKLTPPAPIIMGGECFYESMASDSI